VWDNTKSNQIALSRVHTAKAVNVAKLLLNKRLETRIISLT